MITSIIICIIYLAVLFSLTKLFGVKYTELIKNTKNIKNGLVLPVGIAALLLIVYASVANWIPKVFTFSPRVHQPILWIIPIVFGVAILSRLTHASWKSLDHKGLIYLVIGTAIVGFSEELLVRGIVVSSLLDNHYSIIWVGIASSFIFGILHFINAFNGQDMKLTSIQVVSTFLYGINFFTIFVITGTLWLPILIHFLHDFSLLAQGAGVNKPSKNTTNLDSYLGITLLLLPLPALIFLAW